MFGEPFGQIEEVVLLAPKHSRQRLPHNIGRVLADTRRRDRVVERVGLAPAQLDRLFEAAAEGIATGAGRGIGQPKPDDGGLA